MNLLSSCSRLCRSVPAGASAVVVAVLLTAATTHGQDPPKPPPKFKADFTLRIEAAGPKWSFIIEGTTDLPDGTVLKGRLLALEEVDDFRGGKRIDEESLREGSGTFLFTLKDGKIRQTMYETARRPYSLWYRARLIYDPDEQHADIAEKAGKDKVAWTADLHHGTPKDLEAELSATLKEVTLELEEVQTLFRDLRGRFQVWVRKPDAAAFEEWRKGFEVKVEAIRKKNELRYGLWVLWIERQAKFRFESFADRFDAFIREFKELLETKKEIDAIEKKPAKADADLDALQNLKGVEQNSELRINGWLSNFVAYVEESREALGVDTPSDPDAVGAILKEYEAATTELAALSAKKDASAWKAGAPKARERAHRALMKLVVPGLLPRRSYDRVLELTAKFGELHTALAEAAAGQATPEAILSDHAQLVADFRKYAGVK